MAVSIRGRFFSTSELPFHHSLRKAPTSFCETAFCTASRPANTRNTPLNWFTMDPTEDRMPDWYWSKSRLSHRAAGAMAFTAVANCRSKVSRTMPK